MLTLIKTPPRIPELLFAAVLIWLFATGQGWQVLLADGDTGWHIRNCEQIIDTRSVPHADSFSFDSAGHPWFAWEWLSDVLFAALFRLGGLKAVTVFCGIVIAGSVSVLFRHMVWRSVGVCIALPLTLLAVGASSIHYLARPHVIGLLFFAMVAWIVDRDRSNPARLIWSLPLLFMLWANCHGSFLAGLAMLVLWWVEDVRSHRVRPLARPARIFAFCAGATLCNPYGWHLHAHALDYLHSGWIQASIEEFQSPRFRSENMFQYEILLIAGLSALPWLLRRGEFYSCCAILSLGSRVARLGASRAVIWSGCQSLYCLVAPAQLEPRPAPLPATVFLFGSLRFDQFRLEALEHRLHDLAVNPLRHDRHDRGQTDLFGRSREFPRQQVPGESARPESSPLCFRSRISAAGFQFRSME